MAVRQGATRLDLTTEGLIVVLYDEKRLRELKRGRTLDVLTGEASGADPVDRADRIARQGLLVAYDLAGDGPVAVEIAVGPPLTEAERAAAEISWLAPQQALLSLPSGRLCVETTESLRIGAHPPSATGGSVRVPPGDYVLTLFRTDHRDDRHGTGDLPLEVVTLTPRPAIERPVRVRAFLSIREALGEREIPEAPPPRAGVFRGLCFPGLLHTVVSNLDGEAARALGLRFGMRLEVEWGGALRQGVYGARANPSYFRSLFGPPERLPAPAPRLHGRLGFHELARRDVVEFEGLGDRETIAAQPEGTPLAVRALPDPYLPPPDPGLLKKRRVTRGRVRCAVLHSGDHAAALSCRFEDLLRIGLEPGGRGVARFAGLPARRLFLERVPRDELKIQDLVPLSTREASRVRSLERERLRVVTRQIGRPGGALVSAAADAELGRIEAEIAAVAWSPEKLRHAALAASAIHHWEADASIVLLRLLTPDFAARPILLGAAVGSEVEIARE